MSPSPVPASAFQCLGLCLAVSAAIAQDAPEELVKLRRSYESEIARITEPTRKRYLDALQRLQEQYTRSGEIDKALRIKEEMEKEAAAKGKETITTRTLGGTDWQWGSGGILKLERGGKASHSLWSAPGTWKRIDELSISVQRPGSDPPMTAVFSDEELTSAVITSHLGTSTTLTKIEK